MRGRRPLLAGAVAVLTVVPAPGLAGCSAAAGDGDLVLFAAVRTQEGGRGRALTATELTPERGLDVLGLSGPASVAGNPELPDVAPDVRRFAFVLTGCRADSARLVRNDRSLDAELRRGGEAPDSPCAVPQRFLAVFDVPADDVPADVLVG